MSMSLAEYMHISSTIPVTQDKHSYAKSATLRWNILLEREFSFEKHQRFINDQLLKWVEEIFELLYKVFQNRSNFPQGISIIWVFIISKMNEFQNASIPFPTKVCCKYRHEKHVPDPVIIKHTSSRMRHKKCDC